MEVSSLDSPGTSSGYCSGTEEELTFNAAICDSDFPNGCPDVFPESIHSPLDLDSCGLNSLMCSIGSSGVTSSGVEGTRSREEVNEVSGFGLNDANFRDIWNSWFSDLDEENSEHGGGIFDLAKADFIEPCVEMLEELHEREEWPSRFLHHFETTRTSDEGAGLLTGELSQLENSREDAICSPEKDWNMLLSDEEWQYVSGSCMSVHGCSFSPEDLWKEDGKCEGMSVVDSMIMTGSDSGILADNRSEQLYNGCEPTHDCSSDSETRLTKSQRLTTSDRSSSKQSGPHVTPEDSQRTSRSCPVKPKTDHSTVKDRNLLRTPAAPETKDRTAPLITKSVIYHGLEDHRYSSRRCEAQAVKPRPVSSSERQGTKDSCSVLEALLRTNSRLNPNRGSNALFCKESKKRRNTETAKSAAKQSRTSGHSTKMAPTSRRHQNTLLHNLLTCRMDEVERRRTSLRGGKPGGRIQSGAQGGGLIPSDNPIVDCSFLFDDPDAETHAKNSNFGSSMSCSDSEGLKEEQFKVSHYACSSDDDADTWFTNYFGQTS